jgi:hypothetical protein
LGYLKRILTDSLFRRFLIASAFAGAVVWVAVDAFNVEVDLVIEFFVLSIVLVCVMVVGAFLVALVFRLIRGKREPLSFDKLDEDGPGSEDS